MFTQIQPSQAKESSGIIKIPRRVIQTDINDLERHYELEHHDTVLAVANVKTFLDASPHLQNIEVAYTSSFEEADEQARSMSINE